MNKVSPVKIPDESDGGCEFIIRSIVDELRSTMFQAEENSVQGVSIRDDLVAAHTLINVLDRITGREPPKHRD